MTAAAPPVHIEIAGFTAFTEFPHEFDPSYPKITDACGPCANIACLNAVLRWGHSVDVLIAEMVHRRQQDIDNGLFRAGSGQNLDELEASVKLWDPTIVTHKTPMGSDAEAIRQALKAAMLRGNPCVLNILNAQKLPNNEQGVQHHFVAVGGIDTALGYKIANGDYFPFAPEVPAYWVRWPDILAAQPYGLLEYEMQPLPAPPPPASPDIAAALAALADAEAAIAKARSALAL